MTEQGQGNGLPVTSLQSTVPQSMTAHRLTLDAWSQGDLVGPLPLTWLTPPGSDEITGAVNRADVTQPYFNRSANVPFVVASQTCDLSATGTGAHQPLAMVVPLTDSLAIGPATSKLAKDLRVPYLVPSIYLDESTPERTWFADLRLVTAVSKGVLLEREAGRKAFGGDQLLRFAASLAHKFGRVALDDLLVDTLPAAISAHIEANPTHERAFAGTDEVRVLITQGHVLRGESVTVYALVDKSVLEKAKEAWPGWEEPVRRKFKAARLRLNPTVVATAEELTAAEYRRTVALRIDKLPMSIWP